MVNNKCWKKVSNTKNAVTYESKDSSATIFIFPKKDVSDRPSDSKKWKVQGNRTATNLDKDFMSKAMAERYAKSYMKRYC